MVAKLRNFIITSFETKYYKLWDTLTDSRIRLLSYQLEKTSTEKVHIQAYLETYSPMSYGQVKMMLLHKTLHIEQRAGPRRTAYDYTKKEATDVWYKAYPAWKDHGARIEGTEHKEMGVFSTEQGRRTELERVIDRVQCGATEREIAETCSREYIKFSTGIRRWLQQRAFKSAGKFSKVKVVVLEGGPGSGKTRFPKDLHGAENVYSPKWNGSKFWFDGYQNHEILLINEIDSGNMRLEYLLQLLDNYHLEIEQKGSSTVSNWHTIYITTNDPIETWFNYFEGITDDHRKALARRINQVIKFGRVKCELDLCDIPTKTIQEVTKPSITLVTSVPPEPSQGDTKTFLDHVCSPNVFSKYHDAIFTNRKRLHVTNGQVLQTTQEKRKEGEVEISQQENRYTSGEKDSPNRHQVR